MLTAAEVVDLRFSSAGLFRAGYAADAVDDWLDHVIRTLRAYEGDAEGTVELLAEDARETTLPTARGRDAYATEEVDVAIERVAIALAEHEREA
ncbi:DivIVA domain-containing protein [Agrococcus baldri]|uniref:DivIVA domain-containing protein n=1 Tax=Agrococcus baldri TaxID=153730 RepID=A0AA94KYS2_9MICO|nr:DivIVA domain-containing protein [Agrococcus baldri]SFS01749.1 DivIVA domain-containing protein [Agrococcus baldri]